MPAPAPIILNLENNKKCKYGNKEIRLPRLIHSRELSSSIVLLHGSSHLHLGRRDDNNGPAIKKVN